ncbi:redox-regulated ATPase YchF [bacterium]|nr:MAG: redox-regulated ATPase YchF [bacterium]
MRRRPRLRRRAGFGRSRRHALQSGRRLRLARDPVLHGRAHAGCRLRRPSHPRRRAGAARLETVSHVSLSCGIVGLPNVGKSTIFNALTRSAAAAAANYPFCTIDPNVGIVPVPDQRLDVLAKLFHSQKIVPATTEFIDIAGLVRGASKGEGLGNAFLSHIRNCDAIAMVVRCFDDGDVIHVEGTPDPARDVEIIALEMALADLGTLERHLPKLERMVRADAKLGSRLEAAKRLQQALEEGRPARSLDAASSEREVAQEIGLLTAKPLMYVANVDEGQLAQPGPMADAVREIARREHSQMVLLSGKIEAELAGLPPEEAQAFLDELGAHESGLDRMAVAAYDLLGLTTFLTAGEKETRAWPIRKGTKAPQAAGVIHSDIERGFIRAEIAAYDDLVRLGSLEAVRSAGLLRSEGKDYVMQEGDVVTFRFNV